jgi:DNA repair protein RecO (recombination protein O)
MTNSPWRHLVTLMETRVTDQISFLLRRRDWQNTSLMLDFFTRDYGCIRAIAKGARRNPATASYQPFVMLSINWSGKHELKTLTAIEGQPLPVGEENYLSLLYVNELIAALLPQGESNPQVFASYLSLLQQSVETIDEINLRRFELELMQLLGYFPDAFQDTTTGKAIRDDTHYQFVINRGFVACPDSARDSISGQVVIDWAEGNYQRDSVLRLAKSVLRSTIDFNLHGKTLKSRDVYLEMKRRK